MNTGVILHREMNVAILSPNFNQIVYHVFCIIELSIIAEELDRRLMPWIKYSIFAAALILSSIYFGVLFGTNIVIKGIRES